MFDLETLIELKAKETQESWFFYTRRLSKKLRLLLDVTRRKNQMVSFLFQETSRKKERKKKHQH